jgi:hypothetical protein
MTTTIYTRSLHADAGVATRAIDPTTLGTLTTAVATAVSDGASPTQAHVTAISNALNALVMANPTVGVTVEIGDGTSAKEVLAALKDITQHYAKGSGL